MIKIDAKKKYLIIAGLLFIACVVAWYMFSGGLHDNGSGADAVRGNIQSAGQHNDAAIGELDRAKQTARDLEAANAELAATSAKLREVNERLEQLAQQDRERIDRNKEIIAEGQRILRQVRARGPIGEK